MFQYYQEFGLFRKFGVEQFVGDVSSDGMHAAGYVDYEPRTKGDEG